jgi:hypothetical protein
MRAQDPKTEFKILSHLLTFLHSMRCSCGAGKTVQGRIGENRHRQTAWQGPQISCTKGHQKHTAPELLWPKFVWTEAMADDPSPGAETVLEGCYTADLEKKHDLRQQYDRPYQEFPVSSRDPRGQWTIIAQSATSVQCHVAVLRKHKPLPTMIISSAQTMADITMATATRQWRAASLR